MNREIKFKAFYDGELRDVLNIDLKHGAVYLPGILQDNVRMTRTSRWVPIYDANLMQYTGLNDRNGVEIYEGDIVRYGVADFEVFAGRGGFGLQEMNSALSMKHGDMWITALMSTFDTFVKCGALEVIGNRFESELMEGKE